MGPPGPGRHAPAGLWLARYNGPGDFNEAYSVAVSPSGATVYVTGYSYGCICGGGDYATVAYNAATGARPAYACAARSWNYIMVSA